MDKAKLVLFITFAALVAMALVGMIVLMILGMDIGLYVTQVTILLGLVMTAAGSFWALGTQGKKIDTIQRQTNGNLTAQIEENRRLTDLLIAQGVNPNDPETQGITVVPAEHGGAADEAMRKAFQGGMNA